MAAGLAADRARYARQRAHREHRQLTSEEEEDLYSCNPEIIRRAEADAESTRSVVLDPQSDVQQQHVAGPIRANAVSVFPQTIPFVNTFTSERLSALNMVVESNVCASRTEVSGQAEPAHEESDDRLIPAQRHVSVVILSSIGPRGDTLPRDVGRMSKKDVAVD